MQFWFLILIIACLENCYTEEVYLDLNEENANVIIWKSLFEKLNSLLSEKEQLTQTLANINQRLDQLDNRITAITHPSTSLAWTSILRRQDDSINFYRGWNEYREGFGDPNGNFFVGLQWLHNITTSDAPQELLVILKDYDNQTRYAKYDLFRIGSELEKFPLKDLGSYTGDAGDALKHHIGSKFTTFDQDNDNNDERNCAVTFHGAWWFFGPCYSGHLNGPYRYQQFASESGISWDPWRGWKYSLKYAEMFIRQKL